MKTSLKSAAAGFVIGLVFAGASAQALQHEHTPAVSPTEPPVAASTQHPPAERMQGMEAMMSDPAMRQKMIEDMGQCRDMMSMMMEHMQHHGQMETRTPSPKP